MEFLDSRFAYRVGLISALDIKVCDSFSMRSLRNETRYQIFFLNFQIRWPNCFFPLFFRFLLAFFESCRAFGPGMPIFPIFFFFFFKL